MFESIVDDCPIACVLLDSAGIVVYANEKARGDFDVVPGDSVKSFIHADDHEIVSTFISDPASQKINCVIAHRTGQKSVSVEKFPVAGHLGLWFQDQSVIKALEGQLRNTRVPERKLMRDLRHLGTTALSYGELAQVILADNSTLTGTAHGNLSRYHNKLMDHLQVAMNMIDQQDNVAAKTNRRKHILIVDDEAIVTEFLTELMRARSYKVTSFTVPGHALKSFEINPGTYDLAILDHHMPELDGITLAQQLQAPDFRLPVVLCTNKTEVQVSDSVQQVLIKPIDINQLMSTVSELLD